MKGSWMLNINFLAVPIELVEQFKGRVSKTEWVVWAKWYNESPSIWNLAYLEDGVVKVFLYGFWEPLERELRVTRITADKSLHSVKGAIMQDVIDALRVVSKEMHVEKVFFETCRFRVFLRKLNGEIKLSRARILEVL